MRLILLDHDYVAVDRNSFDRDQVILLEAVLAFVRESQSKDWARLEVLHGERIAEQVACDLCTWMDANGSVGQQRATDFVNRV